MRPDYIHAIHDPGGETLFGDRPGWVVFTEAIGADPSDLRGGDYRAWADRGIGVIVRLNHGYGKAGTLPLPDRYGDFAQRVANFMQHSRGCTRYILGNEPNHSAERPNGQPIRSRMYADCFLACAKAVRQRGGNPRDLIPAPVAPWNAETGDWVGYWQDVLTRVADVAGGLAIHTYTHGADPALVTSDAKMDAPFANRHYHFRAYRDLLAVVPESMRQLPVYITETDQDDPWLDQNNGWVQAAYAEIDAWNRQPNTQKIHCLALYRWPNYDRWGFQDKTGVQDDLRAAVAKGYRVPSANAAGSQGSESYLPIVTVGDAPTVPDVAPAPVKPVEWDDRLTARGVIHAQIVPNHDGPIWRLVKAEYLEEKEHIFVNTLDEQGKPLAGVEVMRENGGRETQRTEDKRHDPYALGMANFPMHAAGWAYSVRVAGGQSDTVRGMGLGSVEQPEMGIHVSYRLTFQRVWANAATPQGSDVAQPQTPQKPVEQPKPQPAPTVPPLVHPVADPAYRTITQRFGERPDYYSRFAVDGVPLRGHNGVDFGTPIGIPILPVDAGEVVEAANDANGYGNYVKIRHAWGESLYAHLSEIRVDVGEPVAPGVPLVGLSGNTGNSTGPHLHLGLRVAPFDRRDGMGGYTDPLPYLQQDHAAPSDIPAIIRAAAREFGVDEHLLLSQLFAESSFDPRAVSSAGAMGLGQIMLPTWREYAPMVGAREPYSAEDNARVAAYYLHYLIHVFGSEWQGLVAYGWGEGNLRKRPNEVPPIWREYANKIMHGKWLLDAVRG